MADVAESDRADVLDLLPHRPPFLFIDRVINVRRGVEGHAQWQLSGEEEFFRGHFPNRPVVPGVLIAEALAQLAGLVGLHRESTSKSQSVSEQQGGRLGGRLAHVDIRFEREVRPPSVIHLHASLQRALGALRQFEVRALVDDQSVASGSLTLAQVNEA